MQPTVIITLLFTLLSSSEGVIQKGCMCTIDGYSSGSYIEYGQDNYVFIGCGSHSAYRLDTAGAGYDIVWCYVQEPNDCSMSLSQINTLPQWGDAAWRECTGDMCRNSFSGILFDGVFKDVLNLDSPYDWSDCCAYCSNSGNCSGWSFNWNNGDCILFSSITGEINSTDYYSGYPGYYDAPLWCQTRGYYGLCDNVLLGLLISGLLLLSFFFPMLVSYIIEVCTYYHWDLVDGQCTHFSKKSNTYTTYSAKNGTSYHTVTDYFITLTYSHNQEKVIQIQLSKDDPAFTGCCTVRPSSSSALKKIYTSADKNHPLVSLFVNPTEPTQFRIISKSSLIVVNVFSFLSSLFFIALSVELLVVPSSRAMSVYTFPTVNPTIGGIVGLVCSGVLMLVWSIPWWLFVLFKKPNYTVVTKVIVNEDEKL